MANIGYVTSNTGHGSVATTKTMLESKGHTVTLFTSAAATAVGLASYDIVLTSRTTENATHSAVIKAVLDTGKPVLCGFGTLTAGSDQSTTPAVICKIAPSERGITPDNQRAFYADVASPVYDGAGITIPSTVNFATADTFTASIPKAGASPGDIVGSLASTATDRGIIFFAAGGSATYDGGVFGGNIGYCGFLYGGAAYSAEAATIIDNMIQLLLSSGFLLSGSVKDSLANPLARKVRAHRRSDGGMVASATSNGTTGAFSLTVWSTELHYIVCLDADGGTKNALIKDRVIPVEL